MDNGIGSLINACTEIWKSIGITQKTSILLIMLLGFVAAGTVIYMGSRPDWQVLYAGLDEESASKIYELVKDENIPYKLKNSGKTILVPSKHIYSLRLRAVNEGVSVGSASKGLELFDNVKLGLTEKQQQVGFQRAIQGELERMISEMPGVVSSRVMLAMPGRRIVRGDKKRNPTASVLVVLENGWTLSAPNVNSIRYMVASAVESMTPNDVTITDNYGTLLAKRKLENESADMDNNNHLNTQAAIERSLKGKAESILRPIVGKNSVIAMVTCILDFDQLDRVVEVYDDKKKVIVHEKSVAAESSKKDKESRGVAGTGSNLVSVKDPESATDDENMESDVKRTIDNQYLVPKTTERFVKKGVRIKSLSVAVSIAKKDENPRSKKELENLKSLVISAVGAVVDDGSGRSDSVEILEADFFDVEPQLSEPVMSSPDMVMYGAERIIRSPVVRPIVGLGLLFILYRLFRSNFNKSEIGSMDISGGLYESENIYSISQEQGQETLESNSESVTEIPESNPIETIRSRSEAEPQLVAGAMESWLGK